MSFNCRSLLKHCRPIKRSYFNNNNERHLSLSAINCNSSLHAIVSAQIEKSHQPGYCLSNNNSNLPTLFSKRRLATKVLRPYVDPKSSYAFGKSNEHLVYSTIARELDKQVTQIPDEIAFISHTENKKVTFRQLNHDINKLAKSMATRFNIKRGDFVGIFSYNCYHWLLIQFVCARLGAIMTPINPSYKAHELAFVLKKGKIKCLFMPGPKSVQSELNNHLNVLQSDQIVDLSKAGELQLEHVILMDANTHYKASSDINFKLSNCQLWDWSDTQLDGQIFKSLQEAEEAGVSEEDAFILDIDHVSPDDLFAVYYTSGTTGTPKGACISQFTVVNNVRLCQTRLRNGRQHEWKAISATTLPLFHIFAGVLNALSPVVSNSTIVFSGHKYDIGTFVESVIQHDANVTTLTPTMLIDMLTYIEQKRIVDLPLQIIQPGGAALPPELVTRTFKVLPNLEELRSGYGSTENGAVATFQTIHEPFEARAFTVGPPLDFTEIRIVEPNSDRLVPLGERGEIQTRGHNTMTEYLDEPKKTLEVITASKWYKTGDIGLMHPHGSIEISGRLKHMIIKGGENIYPEEVEQVMHKMTCIEKVHVVGVPDRRFGEQVCAWVKLKPDYVEAKGRSDEPRSPNEIHADDVIKFCKDNITYFKVPKYLMFVDDFPMTPTKKVQSNVMVERSIKFFGLENEKGGLGQLRKTRIKSE